MSTLSRGDEIEKDFYQLRSQEWAVGVEQAKSMIEAGIVVDQAHGARRVVYVIMGNDFPEAVFSQESAAEAFCVDKRRKNVDDVVDGTSRPIYWRYYEFTLDAEVGK